MAGLLLATVGSAIGGAIGGTILGVTSAVIGQAIGAVIGSAIDQYLFAPTIKTNQEGPRLSEASVMTSVEGANIFRGYGRFKVAGNIIWASRFREEVIKKTTKTGGKGGGGGVKTTTTTYNYYVNVAIGLCEGEIQNVLRIWADGKLLSLSDYTYRIYRGTEDQVPDSMIETLEGSGNVPAYKGLAYIVFEDFLLNKFGNRIPQMAFEVIKPIKRSDGDTAADLITAVNLLPGDTEFGLDPEVISQSLTTSGIASGGWSSLVGGSIPSVFDSGTKTNDEEVEARNENAHLDDNVSDWDHALAQLAINAPNCGVVSLVVSWYGDDLRVANCTIRPKVESDGKTTSLDWLVAGLGRDDAEVITVYGGSPAYKGSPNDLSLYRAIVDLKARGFEVMIYPQILMDIEEGNTLPNPYSDNAAELGQYQYPWRGHLTCSPAIGYAGSPDRGGSVLTQINSFMGSASNTDFSGSDGVVTYSGPDEWTYRRFILHIAEVCRQAGGVDYFLIGSQMRELTKACSSYTFHTYPFVNGLVTIAGMVSTMMPSSKISYAANWDEYHSHKLGITLNFPLDTLWSDANVDFVGIDFFFPITDWRDGQNHDDYGTGNDVYGRPRGPSIYDIDYLKGKIQGGEHSDFIYSSDADRESQTRTIPVSNTIAAPADNWAFAIKNIHDWWSQSHFIKTTVGSIPTSWVAESKPIIFTAAGCPAVNRGTNQLDAFYDPKSYDSRSPWYSSGSRDDEIQRQFIRAMVEFWSDTSNNPISSVYSDNMVDKDRICFWGYDIRPWPTFPLDETIWGDSPNWLSGHWLNGRLDSIYLPDLLTELADEYELTADLDFSKAYGGCDGYIIQAKGSFRSSVESLASLFLFDIIESGPYIKAVSQHEAISVATVDQDDLADMGKDKEVITLTRRQAAELPLGTSIKFIDTFRDYELSAVSQQRETVEAESLPSVEAPIVIDFARGQQLVERLLYSSWVKRTRGEFGLMPEFIYLEASDVITINDGTFNKPLRIQSIADGNVRHIQGESFDQGIFQPANTSGRTRKSVPYSSTTLPLIAMMDLPILSSSYEEHQPYVAAYANPWAGVNFFRSITDGNYGLDITALAPSVIGVTIAEYSTGPTDVWDWINEIEVVIYSGELETLDEATVLNGGNAIAIENSSGGWEIIQFVTATLTGNKTYKLSQLLRGQLGTEDNMENNLPEGSRVVLLESTLDQLDIGISDIGREYYYRYGPADKDIGDTTYKTVTKTFNGRGLKPYSPVHVTGVTDGSGDTLISWTRRTRIGGDSWDYIDDVPLSEAFEKFEVDVLDGSDNVVRTLTVTDAEEVTYTASQQSADSISTPFDVIVYQMSDQVGRGTGRRATING